MKDFVIRIQRTSLPNKVCPAAPKLTIKFVEVPSRLTLEFQSVLILAYRVI